MTKVQAHASHPAIVKRLRRANGHLSSVISMIEQEQPCLNIAQQLLAVEKAIAQAKKALIQDHIDHCLNHMVEGSTRTKGQSLDEFKLITRYL